MKKKFTLIYICIAILAVNVGINVVNNNWNAVCGWIAAIISQLTVLDLMED